MMVSDINNKRQMAKTPQSFPCFQLLGKVLIKSISEMASLYPESYIFHTFLTVEVQNSILLSGHNHSHCHQTHESKFLKDI